LDKANLQLRDTHISHGDDDRNHVDVACTQPPAFCESMMIGEEGNKQHEPHALDEGAEIDEEERLETFAAANAVKSRSNSRTGTRMSS
jgi:hypothetical protein